MMYGVRISSWDHSLREGERAERSTATQGAHQNSPPSTTDYGLLCAGADASAEGRWPLAYVL